MRSGASKLLGLTEFHRHGLMLGVLATLYLGTWVGPNHPLLPPVALLHLGLFLLWQPVVRGVRRLGIAEWLTVLAAVAVIFLALNEGVVLIWVSLLCGMLGAAAFSGGNRRARLTILLVLGYLFAYQFFWVLPHALPDRVGGAPEVLAEIILWGSPPYLVLLGWLPQKLTPTATPRFSDFFHGLMTMLLMVTLLLGTLAAMLVWQLDYIRALLATVFGMAGLLLLLAWLWAPRGGFEGLGQLLGRYLLTLQLPMERWLAAVARLRAVHPQPEALIQAGVVALAELPDVNGAAWQAGDLGGESGDCHGRPEHHQISGVRITLWRSGRSGAAVMWHANLLVHVLVEAYLSCLRERALRQIRYLQAIHETGARLTHDIKNILQSLQGLCCAVEESDDPVALREALLRQLPALTSRLAQTVDRLRQPLSGEEALQEPAEIWFSRLVRRLPEGVNADMAAGVGAQSIASSLFDDVVENLLVNALAKRQDNPPLNIQLHLGMRGGRVSLSVTDNGAVVPVDVAECLFEEPVVSRSGLGVGLYQAARRAACLGYTLELAVNQPGCVQFRLQQASPHDEACGQ